jgi:hypothetical protein
MLLLQFWDINYRLFLSIWVKRPKSSHGISFSVMLILNSAGAERKRNPEYLIRSFGLLLEWTQRKHHKHTTPTLKSEGARTRARRNGIDFGHTQSNTLNLLVY